MELYQFFASATEVLDFFPATPNVWITCVVIAFALWLTAFIFNAIGLKQMAKYKGLKKRWLAFMPFVNLWYMGKIVGECRVFGQRMKRAGLYAMLAQIFITIGMLLYYASFIYLQETQGAPLFDQYETPYWVGLTGFAKVAYGAFTAISYALPLVELLYTVFIMILLVGLYKKYAPSNYMILSVVSLLVPVSRFIIVFVLRNRAPIDYEAYMRAKHEQYVRQQQQYYHGNYGGYGGYNPYGQQTNSPPKQEDPFDEFGGTKPNANGNNGQSGGDDFFD